MKRNRWIPFLGVALGATLVVGALVGGTGWALARMTPGVASFGTRVAAAAPHMAATTHETAGRAAASGSAGNFFVGANTIADISEQLGPAVVRVETTTVVERSENPFFQDPFFRDFFRDFTPEAPRTAEGLGTGVVVSQDGHIITNNHVVDGARDVKVRVLGRDEPYTARVVGRDTETDLALLKIDPDSSLTVAALGDSDRVRVGEWVVAIGNPHGFDHTVSVGVISAKQRPLNIKGHAFKNLLQTDAAINPGNSGGPLLNLQGQVIGINTAIRADAQGIGFAIPSNTVRDVYQELLTNGKVRRAILGVQVQSVTRELADYLKLEDEPRGALVAFVQPGSAADQAGVQRYDIILEVDRAAVKGPDDLSSAVKARQPGDTLLLLVWRDGRSLTLTATLGEQG